MALSNFYASGGDVMMSGAHGVTRLSVGEADALGHVIVDEQNAFFGLGEHAAAMALRDQCLELGRAIAAAMRWQRAGA